MLVPAGIVLIAAPSFVMTSVGGATCCVLSGCPVVVSSGPSTTECPFSKSASLPAASNDFIAMFALLMVSVWDEASDEERAADDPTAFAEGSLH